MADTSNGKKVAAIVPAYNEADRIGGVLGVLTSYGKFSEIIVVDDGSRDETAQTAAKFPVRVIRHDRNRGKAQSLESGVRAADTPYVFFCDADMTGLTTGMLDEILEPVLKGETEMMVAMHNRPIYYLSFLLSIIPLLGGQRALTRDLWDRIPAEYKKGFMIEAALNFYAQYWGKGYRYKVMEGLGQVIKEKKYGLRRGLVSRFKMQLEIFEIYARLQLLEVPATIKSFRIAITNIAGAGFGAIVGVVILFASYTGPATFVRQVFADDLATESSTPLVDLLLYIAANAGVNLLATIGLILMGFNILVIVLNIANVRYFYQFTPDPPERIR